MEESAEALTALDNLAFRHEVRREAIFRELEAQLFIDCAREVARPMASKSVSGRRRQVQEM